MVIATVVLFRKSALRINRSPELATPDDEGAIEQTEAFEIGKKRRGRLIGIFALVADFLRTASASRGWHCRS